MLSDSTYTMDRMKNTKGGTQMRTKWKQQMAIGLLIAALPISLTAGTLSFS